MTLDRGPRGLRERRVSERTGFNGRSVAKQDRHPTVIPAGSNRTAWNHDVEPSLRKNETIADRLASAHVR
jgi:hypothetical protein